MPQGSQTPSDNGVGVGAAERRGSTARITARIAPAPEEKSAVAERDQRARAALSYLQGEADGLQSKAETRKQQKFESIEDDYLVGALAIESYVVFRTRPILERLERRGRRLAVLLQFIEVLVFLIQSTLLPVEPKAFPSLCLCLAAF